jgi:hypothetical protein
MAASAPLVFSPITPEQYVNLIQKANAAGLALHGNSGSAGKYGVEVAWQYSAEEQTLTIQCMRTPFLIKASDVNAKIQSVVNESLA